MKTFFSSTFIDQESLSEERIYYPIRLEYYKIIHENAKFGINVVKTEYREDKIKVENKKIKYLSNDEERIEKILTLLKENEVTPIAVEDILSDFTKKTILDECKS